MFAAKVIMIAGFAALAAFAIFISVMVYLEHNKPRRWTYTMRSTDIKRETGMSSPAQCAVGLNRKS